MKHLIFLNLKARIVWDPGLSLDPLELLNAEEVGVPVHRHRVHQLVPNQLSDRLGEIFNFDDILVIKQNMTIIIIITLVLFSFSLMAFWTQTIFPSSKVTKDFT